MNLFTSFFYLFIFHKLIVSCVALRTDWNGAESELTNAIPGMVAPGMKRPLEGDSDNLQLRYSIFDWDDNVVHMPTRIWMENVSDGSPVPLSTADYAERRHDPGLRHTATSFREFNDETGDFKGDLANAMASGRWRAPSFEAFKQAVMEGRLFAVVTARGHSEETIRQAVQDFIRNILSEAEQEVMLESLRTFHKLASSDGRDSPADILVKQYLDLCSFNGVTHPDFVQTSGTAKPEEGKKVAIRGFVQRIVSLVKEVFSDRGKKVMSISFGFSDDDRKNVEVVDALMRDELSVITYETRVKFVVFDTSGGGKPKRLKAHISDPVDSS